MLKEEYAILKQKHLKNGCDSREAHELISIFKLTVFAPSKFVGSGAVFK